ncbi:MAG: hypothetical protein ACI8Y4_002653 [Candidatus Poriferisodalaceae bacterium]|jgi:hypothetical protein
MTSVTKRKPTAAAPLEAIGWREWVQLPELCLERTKAKIDSGARTSSLHAFDLEIEHTANGDLATFEIHPRQRSVAGSMRVRVPVFEYRRVRPSTGRAELRPVIRTMMQLGLNSFPIEVTLTSRDTMGFRMLLGRRALAGRYLVNPGRSFIVPTNELPTTFASTSLTSTKEQ